jgi:hypothetical protein
VKSQRRQRRLLSITVIALGAFLLLVAGEFIPGAEPRADDAPNAIIALSGLVFVIAGFMAYVGRQSRTNDLLAALLCLVFGVIGGWVAVAGSDEGFSGGIPFLSSAANVKLARGLFGFGSLICFLIAAWALNRFFARADSDRAT